MAVELEEDLWCATTIEALIERLPELCQEYEPHHMLILDELGLFFQALLEKGFTGGKKAKYRRKKIETTNNRLFIVPANGSFVFKSVAVWRSKVSRCFRSL